MTVNKAKTHNVKILPVFFEAVLRQIKNAEVRFNDRDYQVNDNVVLCEYDSKKLTGRKLTVRITHILSGYGIERGYVMLSFRITDFRNVVKE